MDFANLIYARRYVNETTTRIDTQAQSLATVHQSLMQQLVLIQQATAEYAHSSLPILSSCDSLPGF